MAMRATIRRADSLDLPLLRVPSMDHSQLVISLVASSVLVLSTLNKNSEPLQRERSVLHSDDLNLFKYLCLCHPVLRFNHNSDLLAGGKKHRVILTGLP
jgi:hypothetical protein